LGTIDINYSAVDVFPMPNVSGERNKYLEPPSGKAWADLYAQTTGLSLIARFHSHPNGTVVSEQDMRACGQGLHLWVIHHGLGKHTYVAALHLRHIEVVIKTTQMEKRHIMLMGDRLHLGDVQLTRSGEFEAAPLATQLLHLDEKSRRVYMAAITAPPNPRHVDNFITYADLAVIVHSTPSTVREWMKPCIKSGLVVGIHGGIKPVKPKQLEY